MEQLLVLLLGAGAFWDGLYGPGQQLLAAAVMAVLLLLKRGTVHLARLEIGLLGLFATGVGMGTWRAAAAGSAAHGVVIAAGWVLALLLGRRLAADERLPALICRIWAWAGLLMVFAGLAALSYLPAHHSGRLASFLGYPIAVGMLGLLGLAGTLPDLAEGRWWAVILAFGNGLGVVLSGSRGVWAVAAVLAVYLAWAAPDVLRRAGRRLGGALGLAAAAALWLGPMVAARSRDWHVGGPAAGWAWFMGRAALPGTEGSSVERWTMLKDGLRIVRDFPLGAGYKGWTALHLQRTSYGYYSAEVHSAPVDLAIAFGWLGAVGFLLLLARFLLGLRRGRAWSLARLAFLAGLGALALHATLDWDLSYGIFAVPLWLGFGVMEPPGDEPSRRALPTAAPAALAGLVLAGVVLLGTGDIFADQAERSLKAGDPARALLHASMATAVSPWNDQAHGSAGQALEQLGQRDAALAELNRARALSPYEPWYAQLAGRSLMNAGRWREAAAAYADSTRLWPWDTATYETALDAHLDMLFRASVLGDVQLGEQIRRSGQAILARLDQQKAKEPAHMPRKPMQTDTPTLRRARSMLLGS